MCPADDNPHAPLDAFLEAFWKDLEDDAVRPLAEYLARFPGDDPAIAGQYRAFKDAGAQAMGGITASERSADHIAHYRRIRQIGRGGQGTVYLAEDTRLHRQVALKIMDPGFRSDAIAVERFKREAEITSKLDHPGICTVYETGEDSGARWIAMRYIEGEPLVRKITAAKEGQASASASSFVVLTEVDGCDEAPLASNPPPDTTGPKTWAEISRLLLLFEEAARALHAAHEVGVIHRDIKPGNMMVTTDGKPVILDFGLAVDTGSDLPTLTMTGDLMGTKEYMSPEQIVAHRITLDRRTDVYSLGVSLFECLALRRPFEAPTREGLYQAIMTKAPPDLQRLNPALSADLRVVVATAIEKDRDRRYQTALDLAEELRRLRMHEPIVAKPIGPLIRLRRWAQRNPALATAIGGLFVVLVTGLAVSLFLLTQRDRALSEVTTERDAKNAALTQVTTERNEKQAALTQVTTERNEKQAALTEKSAALSDYDRLGDLTRIETLTADADELWPADAKNAPLMATWIEQAKEIAARLPGHREVLTRIEAAIEKKRAQSQGVAKDPAAWNAATYRATIDARRSDHSARVHAPSTQPDDQNRILSAMFDQWSAPVDDFKLGTTRRLVKSLASFADPQTGLMAQMQQRHAFAKSVERETTRKYRTKWADATRSIADKTDCPKYGGLEIKPQVGLIPIGKDPASGLWEFAQLQTTAPGSDPIPNRDKDGHLLVTESMGIVFVLIPGGTFKMGSVKPGDDQAPTEPNLDGEAVDNESPVTVVRLEPFFVSKYEMTQGQWLRLLGRNPSQYGPGTNFGQRIVDLRHPVEQVSWDDCELWLGRLGLLLPTEAQWEYAARGGTMTPRWTGLGTDGLATAANLADAFMRRNGGPPGVNCESWDDGYSVHAPVGSFAANPFGLHDVLGNVWEWCRDPWCGYDAPADPGDGLRHSAASHGRAGRGGSFFNDASAARSAVRGYYTPDIRDHNIGVRPVRSCRLD